MKTYALLLGLSFALSVLFTPLVRAVAHRFGWLDEPGERKLHLRPTPRIGGLAIFLAFGLALLPLFLIHNRITAHLKIQWPSLEPLPVAVLGIFLLGLADDIFGVGPYIKLVVEVGCSLWLFYHGVFIGPISGLGSRSLDTGMWSLPLTVLWLVGITNAFNLVDGIDGLASGIALFGMTTLVLVSLLTGNIILVAVFSALAGATAGFLLFNFYPASIFLGDSGSLFIGFTLGALSLVWGQKSSLAVAVVGPIVVFALPLADAGLAILRRFFSGVPIFTSDRDHIHHRLLQLGFSPRTVVLILYAACFFLGLATVFSAHISQGVTIFSLALLLICSWPVLSRLGYHELAEINLTVRRGLFEQRKTIAQRVQFRKAVESVGKSNTPQELWCALVECARILDFDHMELCLSPELSSNGSLEGDLPGSVSVIQRSWSTESEPAFALHREDFWSVELPFSTHSDKPSYVRFWRSFSKGELHLRMQPFVQQLSASLSDCVARIQKATLYPTH